MYTEAQLYANLVSNGVSATPGDWLGATSSQVKGTKFSLIKFSDGSSVYVDHKCQTLSTENIARDFFSLFAVAAEQWLQSTPTKDWPQIIRSAYNAATAKDPFASQIWDEVCKEAQAK
jgi:hypothetical protein